MNERRLNMVGQLKRDLEQHNIPSHMHGGVERYIMKGIAPGGFLEAVLENNLFDAVSRADTENVDALKDWVLFIYNCVPSLCWGSRSTVTEWMTRGGWDGIYSGDQAHARTLP